MKKVVNVGGGRVSLPPDYAGWQVILVDIDPAVQPDLVMDGRDLKDLAAGIFDAVYCSHNLEHYAEHDVARVLAGFYHVLADDGFADIRVPDIAAVIADVVKRGLDLDSVLYQSRVGPIRVGDVLYGYQKEIRESGQDYYAHRWGFSRAILGRALKAAGFEHVLIGSLHYELIARAYKHQLAEVE